MNSDNKLENFYIYTTKDVDAIKKCQKIILKNYNEGTLPLHNYLQDKLNNNEILVIAENGENILGFTLLRKQFLELYIILVAVDPDFKRQGIATELYNYIIEHSKGNIALLAEVRWNNIKSRNFHYKMGFLNQYDKTVILHLFPFANRTPFNNHIKIIENKNKDNILSNN